MRKGFSLIELLIVLAIISVLGLVIVSTISNYYTSANEVVCTNNLNKLENDYLIAQKGDINFTREDYLKQLAIDNQTICNLCKSLIVKDNEYTCLYNLEATHVSEFQQEYSAIFLKYQDEITDLKTVKEKTEFLQEKILEEYTTYRQVSNQDLNILKKMNHSTNFFSQDLYWMPYVDQNNQVVMMLVNQKNKDKVNDLTAVYGIYTNNTYYYHQHAWSKNIDSIYTNCNQVNDLLDNITSNNGNYELSNGYGLWVKLKQD